MSDQLNANHWEARYQIDDTPWDLGTVAPAFVEINRRGLKKGRIAVPGAGRGHEAIFFARQGFSVTAFDFAPSACDALKQEAQKRDLHVEAICADFFAIPDQYDDYFDYVLEHTFFCAIPPTRRLDYVATVCRILKPNGLLFGLLLEQGPTTGPPFPTSKNEMTHLLEPYFEIRVLQPSTRSHPRRKNSELWFEASKRVNYD